VGNVWLPQVLNFTSAAAGNVVILTGTGGATAQLARSTSSLRYKDDLKPYVPPKDVIDRLEPVSFLPKGREKGDKRRYVGFTAEAVHDLKLTEFVDYDGEGRPDGLHYPHMVALLVAELQDLRKRVKALEAA
jgi:hypothetical protein